MSYDDLITLAIVVTAAGGLMRYAWLKLFAGKESDKLCDGCGCRKNLKK
jgi:hypothetical protein